MYDFEYLNYQGIHTYIRFMIYIYNGLFVIVVHI
jgi:hypothetical protein